MLRLRLSLKTKYDDREERAEKETKKGLVKGDHHTLLMYANNTLSWKSRTTRSQLASDNPEQAADADADVAIVNVMCRSSLIRNRVKVYGD